MLRPVIIAIYPEQDRNWVFSLVLTRERLWMKNFAKNLTKNHSARWQTERQKETVNIHYSTARKRSFLCFCKSINIPINVENNHRSVQFFVSAFYREGVVLGLVMEKIENISRVLEINFSLLASSFRSLKHKQVTSWYQVKRLWMVSETLGQYYPTFHPRENYDVRRNTRLTHSLKVCWKNC